MYRARVKKRCTFIATEVDPTEDLKVLHMDPECTSGVLISVVRACLGMSGRSNSVVTILFRLAFH
jgi:hypothetical protein